MKFTNIFIRRKKYGLSIYVHKTGELRLILIINTYDTI
jgi:hypothetical protein